MTALPQPYPQARSPRIRLPDITPVILRFPDGHRLPVDLTVVSLTGGLLRVERPVDHGARVRLMFLTNSGPVLGAAEMLRAVSWTEQPFRFLSLAGPDHRRLEATIQSSFPAVNSIHNWIRQQRNVQAPTHQRISLRAIFVTAAAATVALAGILYACGLYPR
jgi:hypothetical protein